MSTRQMAYPPPSLICHYFGLGLRPDLQAPLLREWSLFLCPDIGLQPLHGCPEQPAFVRLRAASDSPSTTCRRLATSVWSFASADDPKTPPIPSGGVFSFPLPAASTLRPRTRSPPAAPARKRRGAPSPRGAALPCRCAAAA